MRARVPPTATGPDYLVVHVQDIAEQLVDAAALTRRALPDPLTDLPHRAPLLDRLEQALTRPGRQPSAVAVLFADLDDFKQVNDRYAHTAGDQVLIAVAHQLQLLQRPATPPATWAATSSWCCARTTDAARPTASPSASTPPCPRRSAESAHLAGTATPTGSSRSA